MANISTIDPSGAARGTPTGVGQRFTSLPAWQVFAAAQATADQWAECYDGGNLGAVFINAWASIPSATVYPRIYAAAACRHNGTLTGASGTNGAYMLNAAPAVTLRSALPFTRVDGLIINKDTAVNAVVSFQSAGTDYRFENNIVRRNGGTATALFLDTTAAAPSSVNLVANNIFYYAPGVTDAPVAAITVMDGDGSGGPAYFLNNTVLANTRVVTGVQVNVLNPASSLRNNFLYGFDGPGGQFSTEDANFPDSVANYDSNACDDGALPASDIHQQDTSGAITLYIASATDPTPVSGSLLVDNGASTAAFGVSTLDAIGTARPQGPRYDIGAIELIQAAASNRRRRHHCSDIYI